MSPRLSRLPSQECVCPASSLPPDSRVWTVPYVAQETWHEPFFAKDVELPIFLQPSSYGLATVNSLCLTYSQSVIYTVRSVLLKYLFILQWTVLFRIGIHCLLIHQREDTVLTFELIIGVSCCCHFLSTSWIPCSTIRCYAMKKYNF